MDDINTGENIRTDSALHQMSASVSETETAGGVSILLVVRHPVGGIRTFLRYVLRRFPHEKYRLTLIAPRCLDVEQLLQDLDQFRVDIVLTVDRIHFLAFLRTVTRSILQNRFDLVYSHGFTSGLASVLGCLVARTPHLSTCHDVFTDGQFVGVTGKLTKLALTASFAMTNRVHCVTHDARDNLLSYLPLTRLFWKRFVVIRNGIESDRFADAAVRDFRTELTLGSDCFLIGFLGRFMSQKGFRYLVDAMELMKHEGALPRRPVLLVVSPQEGFYREEMAEIDRRGLSESVLFLPFVSNVAPTLKGLDVLVMPSLWEACGLLAMEAMVAGVPVIGSNCVGLREVLDDTPAKIVPMKDAAALARAIMDEMRNPTTRLAREFAPVASERFNVAKQADALEKLIDELALQGRTRHAERSNLSGPLHDDR
jgi:glycosyltransferase involved in cell wall biosynthesis